MATRTRSTRTTTKSEAPDMTVTDETTADAAPDQTGTVTESNGAAFSMDIFDTIRFPGRGRSAENADMDERVADAVARRKKFLGMGAPAEKIVNVVELTDDDGKPLDSKSVDKWRSQLNNAFGRIAPDFKMEWRAIPNNERAQAQYAAYEEALGGDKLSLPTHVYRVVPKNGTDPHQTGDAPAETASETAE